MRFKSRYHVNLARETFVMCYETKLSPSSPLRFFPGRSVQVYRSLLPPSGFDVQARMAASHGNPQVGLPAITQSQQFCSPRPQDGAA